MRRLKAIVSYDGTDFHGWQVQPGLRTVQSAIEAVLAEIEGSTVHVMGSGRTDAGVHACGQVIAFDMANPIPGVNLRRAMNRLLPPSVRILHVGEAAPDFHPRRHATAKTYEYRIWRREICPPFSRLYVHHYPYPLNVSSMEEAARLLEGTHDFSAFAAADETDALGRSKVRTIFSSVVLAEESQIVYRVRGSGFLKHMVRNIAGTLIEAGKGNLTPKAIARFLEPGYPGKAGPRAPARGLFLLSVEYGDAAGAYRREGETAAEGD